jgi:hypothetical protein
MNGIKCLVHSQSKNHGGSSVFINNIYRMPLSFINKNMTRRIKSKRNKTRRFLNINQKRKDKLIRKLTKIINRYNSAEKNSILKNVYYVIAIEIHIAFQDIYPIDETNDIQYIKKLRNDIKALDSNDEFISTAYEIYREKIKSLDFDLIYEEVKGLEEEQKQNNNTMNNLSNMFSSSAKISDNNEDEITKLLEGLSI